AEEERNGSLTVRLSLGDLKRDMQLLRRQPFGRRRAPTRYRKSDPNGDAPRESPLLTAYSSRTIDRARTRAMVIAASPPAAEANCAAPSSVWNDQPPGWQIPIRAAGTRREMLPKSVANGSGAGSGTKSRPAAANASATAALTPGSVRTPSMVRPALQSPSGTQASTAAARSSSSSRESAKTSTLACS